MVNTAEASAVSMCVRKPAGRSFISRSMPIAAPTAAASSKRTTISTSCVTVC
jgi:hypothetical protein